MVKESYSYTQFQFYLTQIPGCKKLKEFFAGKSLKDMSDLELTRQFKKYQMRRLTTGPYFTQRFEPMNDEMVNQFVYGKGEAPPNLQTFLRTMGRLDIGEVTNINVDCFPRVSYLIE